MLLGFVNGQALVGDERGLHGHEIVVLHPNGTGPEVAGKGYPYGDGDSPRCRAGELVYYPLSALEAAAPDSAFILEEVPMAGMGVPAGWSDDGKTLAEPGGIVVVLGFPAYILRHERDAGNVPLGVEEGTGEARHVRQEFARGSLGWTE